MALVIEDGSVVDGANSYITADEYNSWADERFGSGRDSAPDCDQDAEKYILRAMDYFESQLFTGVKKQASQPLQWPRDNVYIDGYYVSNTTIPKEVKTAVYELAYAEEQGNGELASIDRKVKREKVGSIEVEYSDSSSSATIVRSVPMALKKLLSSGGAARVFRV